MFASQGEIARVVGQCEAVQTEGAADAGEPHHASWVQLQPAVRNTMALHAQHNPPERAPAHYEA